MIESIALIISIMVSTTPRHPLARNEKARIELATEIVEASDEYDNDPVLVTVWAYYESSFNPEAVGAIGAYGYMQVVGPASGLCKRRCLKPGSFACGSYLFKYGREKCGSQYRGLLWYASGSCKGTPRAERIVKFRLRKAEQWRKKIK
jgi:hypothetical protein